MSAARDPDQADFDLERFIDMFDEALTSRDERVVNALRSLMMMVILTKPEARNPMADRNSGPLRRLYEDVNHLNRRLHSLEDEMRQVVAQSPSWIKAKEDEYYKELMKQEYIKTMSRVPAKLKNQL